MRHRLAKLAMLTASLGGCSKLYDPERLPGATDAPLPPPDIDACLMTVTEVAPTVIDEGTGEGGSRPALVVITGQNLVNSNMVVTITEAGGATRELKISPDSTGIAVGSRGEHLAIPVTLGVDPMLTAGMNVVLDVKVEQDDCSGGRVSGTVPGKITLRGLGELTDMNAGMLQGGVREFSQINVETATLAPAAGQTMPIVLRSTSSAKIVKNIVLDAVGRVGGPAGGAGGAGGTGVGGVGMPGTGPKPGLTSGAPGGFDTSDPGLNTLNNPNRSSGGAGGDSPVLLGAGGAGGGGGGSIEITALGDLQVGAISARGAAGATGSGGGAAGGGGSGGVILLRAGGDLMAGNLDVRSAGAGARGRARYDAGGMMAMVPAGELGTDHLRGPMFVDLPFSFDKSKPEFRVAGKPLASFKYFFTKEGGGVSGVGSALFDAVGSARVTLAEPLEPGANRLCLVTESGTPTSESSNCYYVAYLR